MDEALLRRLLGAATLLAVAMIVAALLPEPGADARDGVVAYDLRSGREIGAMPLPSVEHPPALKPEEKLAIPRTQEQAPAPTPLPRPSLKVDESLGGAAGWFVQVGSYSSQANARGALEKLFGMGLETKIQSVPVGDKTWYRVRVGPYPAEGAALGALARIKQAGYPDAKLIRPESGAPRAN
jgi:cell division septation protein DedD